MITTTTRVLILVMLTQAGAGLIWPQVLSRAQAQESPAPPPNPQPSAQPVAPQDAEHNAEDEDPLGMLAAAKSPNANEHSRFSLLRDRLPWEKQSLLDVYRAAPDRNHALDADVEAFFDLAARWACEMAGNTPEPDMARMGKALIDAGCTDPMVRAIHAIAVDGDDHPANAAPLLDQAIEPLARSAYHKQRVVYLVRRLGASHAATIPTERLAYLKKIAGDALLECLLDATPGEPMMRARAYLAEHEIRMNLPAEVAISVVDRLEKSPDADPWLKLIASAHLHQRTGWDARGKGTINTVTKKGAEIFRQELTLARSQFVRAHELNPSRPEAASCMIEISYQVPGIDPDGAIAWFKRSIDAQFDFRQSYQRVLDMCRPRWGGSVDQMFNFGQWCAATERYDTRVPQQFIEVLAAMGDEIRDADRIWRSEEVYPAVKDILTKTAAQPANAAFADADRTMLASIAFRLGRFADVREACATLTQATLDERALFNARMFRQEVWCEPILRTGPGADEAAAGDADAQEGKWSEARAHYASARSLCKDDPAAAWAARGHEIEASIHEASAKGEFADVPFEEGLPGWLTKYGTWELQPDGSVRGTSESLNLMLMLRARIGTRWDMEGTFRLVESQDPQKANLGVVFGYDNNSSAAARWQSCLVYPAQKSARLRLGFTNGPDPFPADVAEGANTLRIEVRDNHVRMTINGRPAVDGSVPQAPDRWLPGDLIALGAQRTGSRQVVEFSKIRVRIAGE